MNFLSFFFSPTPKDGEYQQGSVQIPLANFSEHMELETRNRRKYASGTDASKSDSEEQDGGQNGGTKKTPASVKGANYRQLKDGNQQPGNHDLANRTVGERRRRNMAGDIKNSSTSRHVKPFIYSQGGEAREQEM